MIMEKGLTIHYSPEDLAELHEFIQWKTNKAAGKFASVESEFDLRTAAGLIKKAAQGKQNILRQIYTEQGSRDELAQQLENVSLLPDREAERIQSEWAAQSKVQAEAYAAARNRHSHPRSTQGVDQDIFQSTLSWIKRTKLRGGMGGRKALDKN